MTDDSLDPDPDHPNKISISNINILNAKIKGLDSHVGGVIGQALHDEAKNFTNLNVEKSHIYGNTYVGGVIGFSKFVNLSGAKVDGIVSSQKSNTNYVGGVAGHFESGILSESRFEGMVKGGHAVGGLVGKSYLSNITTSYAQASVVSNVSALAKLGGLVGELDNGVGISKSYFYGKISHPCHPTTCTDDSVGNAIGVTSGSFSVTEVFYPVNSNASSNEGLDLAEPFIGNRDLVEALGSSFLANNANDLPRLKDRNDACETSLADQTVADQQNKLKRGTQGNPILLCRDSQLNDMSAYPGNSYKLVRSINLTTPITPTAKTFSGTIDGNGYGLIGFNLDGPSPLAWWSINLGTIKNLMFFSPRVNSTTTGTTALLATTNNKTIQNVSVKDLDWKAETGGGLVDLNSGTIDNYQWDGVIKANRDIGGVARENKGSIMNSRLKGSMHCDSTSCNNFAAISSSNWGVIFQNEISTNISNQSTVNNISFISNLNNGNIKDIHITDQDRIKSNGISVHAVAGINKGGINRVLNEGHVSVEEQAGLPPNLASSASQAMGSTRTRSNIVFTEKDFWINNVNQVYVSSYLVSENCSLTLGGTTLLAEWENAAKDDFSKFAIIKTSSSPVETFPLLGTYVLNSKNFLIKSTNGDCNGDLNQTFKLAHIRPSSFLLTAKQDLKIWSTWTGWNTRDEKTNKPIPGQVWVANMGDEYDKAAVLLIYKNHFLGITTPTRDLPTWEFDPQEGLRLFRID